MDTWMESNTPISELSAILRRSAPAESIDWLDGSISQLQSGNDIPNKLSYLTAMARRKFKDAYFQNKPEISFDEVSKISLEHWMTGDAARLILISNAIEQHPDQSVKIIDTCYRQGDESERFAITAGLLFFPQPETLKHLAMETGRVNSKYLFSSIALNNPYPYLYYTEHEFNQLVLKALFLEIPIIKIVGLDKRVNKELSRMCEEYIRERLSANRTFPIDIWLAQSPFASANSINMMKEYAVHPTTDERYYAVLGLSHHAHAPEIKEFFQHRRKIEEHPQILDIIENSI